MTKQERLNLRADRAHAADVLRILDPIRAGYVGLINAHPTPHIVMNYRPWMDILDRVNITRRSAELVLTTTVLTTANDL